MSEKKPVAPALVLFFLAPVIAELLTSSSPPAEFFTPFGFVVMCALYGTGAVLAHELRVAWNRGWPTMLALGAVFAVIEEGLMVRSFFDPNWPDIAGLGSYGRAPASAGGRAGRASSSCARFSPSMSHSEGMRSPGTRRRSSRTRALSSSPRASSRSDGSCRAGFRHSALSRCLPGRPPRRLPFFSQGFSARLGTLF
jgi:hypothetical protein